MAAGGLMIARGMALVVDGAATTAYHSGGFLKPVHAVLMHGILVLPAVAWIAARAGWNEAQRIRLVKAAVVGYTVAALVTIVMMARLI